MDSSKYITKMEFSKSNIIICSKQLLQDYVGTKKIVSIINLNIDLIIFDEVHFSGTTDLSQSILNTYKNSCTTLIYLTATYNKPLHTWNIDNKCQLFWDIDII